MDIAHERLVKKINEAKRVMAGCVGRNGLYASPERYRYTCWTRDFVYAGQDFLGRSDGGIGPVMVRRHLETLAAKQRPDGRVPVLFLDKTVPWLMMKLVHWIKNRRLSFMLKHYLAAGSIESFSPWTRDSEILFALGVGKLLTQPAAGTLDPDVRQRLICAAGGALAYVEKNLMRDGLAIGSDWRDTRKDLDGVALLTNNCWLTEAYRRLGHDHKADVLRQRIQAEFWIGTHFRDYVSRDGKLARTEPDEFDTLGNALAILFGLATPEQAASILNRAEALASPYGYRLNTVTLPPRTKEEAASMKSCNQFGVVWPFIHGYMILAADHAGRRDLVRREIDKWLRLPGFYEWYDPQTGEGHGSSDQMWSAAMFLKAAAVAFFG